MNPWTIRPLRIPDDFERVAAIWSAHRTEPITVAELAEEERLPHGYQFRVVAEEPGGVAAGRVVGLGFVRHQPFEQPGHYTIRVYTDPERQGRGIGRVLYQTVFDWCRDHGAGLLESSVRENRPDCLAWARRRDFAVTQHIFESVLNPKTFDETPFAGVVEAAEATGIRFFSLADDTSMQAARRLYDLYARCGPDVPGYNLAEFPAFEGWSQYMLEKDATCREAIIVAADGDRFVGCTAAERQVGTGALYTDFTCVDRAYRGRHLALALKLLAIRGARRMGAPYLRTNNDSTNAPMLAINRKLGYVPEPGIYWLQRKLSD